MTLPRANEAGCPFGGRTWQLWVNHTLAHAEAQRRDAKRAMLAVCAPEANAELDARGAIDELRHVLRDPSTARFLRLEDVLARLTDAVADRSAEWVVRASAMRARYNVPQAPVPTTTSAASPKAVTSGHRRTVDWMATDDFRALVAAFDAAAGKGRVYFRPTDAGVVMIGLHDRAPGYVGVSAGHDDGGCRVARNSGARVAAEAETRWRAFESWLPSVRRSSDEERGTIPWIRKALQGGLWLPELGPGWVFLGHEWRFIDDSGTGKRSDVLAVDVASGQLGIVELKDADAKLREARAQVDDYGRWWARDAAQLAPLFTALLRAQGRVYGNDAVATVTVEAGPARLFVGVATPGRSIRIVRR